MMDRRIFRLFAGVALCALAASIPAVSFGQGLFDEVGKDAPPAPPAANSDAPAEKTPPPLSPPSEPAASSGEPQYAELGPSPVFTIPSPPSREIVIPEPFLIVFRGGITDKEGTFEVRKWFKEAEDWIKEQFFTQVGPRRQKFRIGEEKFVFLQQEGRSQRLDFTTPFELVELKRENRTTQETRIKKTVNSQGNPIEQEVTVDVVKEVEFAVVENEKGERFDIVKDIPYSVARGKLIEESREMLEGTAEQPPQEEEKMKTPPEEKSDVPQEPSTEPPEEKEEPEEDSRSGRRKRGGMFE